MPKEAPQPAPATSSQAKPVMRSPAPETIDAVLGKKSSRGGRWLVAAVIVVAIIVLILLALNGNWFGG
jgi:hypothetical protein